MSTFNGFLPGDLTYDPKNVMSVPVGREDLAECIEETREVYDFVERSTWFDSLMGIERKDERATQYGRNTILWAARRHLFGVKLPTMEQLRAMAKAAPIGPEAEAEREAFWQGLRGT